MQKFQKEDPKYGYGNCTLAFLGSRFDQEHHLQLQKFKSPKIMQNHEMVIMKNNAKNITIAIYIKNHEKCCMILGGIPPNFKLEHTF